MRTCFLFHSCYDYNITTLQNQSGGEWNKQTAAPGPLPWQINCNYIRAIKFGSKLPNQPGLRSRYVRKGENMNNKKRSRKYSFQIFLLLFYPYHMYSTFIFCYSCSFAIAILSRSSTISSFVYSSFSPLAIINRNWYNVDNLTVCISFSVIISLIFPPFSGLPGIVFHKDNIIISHILHINNCFLHSCFIFTNLFLSAHVKYNTNISFITWNYSI